MKPLAPANTFWRQSCLTWLAIACLALAGCKKEDAAPEKDGRAAASKPPEAGKPADRTQPDPPPENSGPTPGDMTKVGNVVFPTSCDPAVQAQFERGVALLHSFFYQESRAVLTEVAKADPECAIAQWGIAMTYYHPLWSPPSDEEMASGVAAVDAAAKATKKSDREQAMIDSVTAFYKTEDTGEGQQTGMSCHGVTGGHPARAKAYSDSLGVAHDKFPDDEEIAAFYALSLLGSAPPVDVELKNQRKSAEILERLWAKRKDHPGVAHYLIHSYDYPPLAEKGLAAANQYAQMAPWVPHALHMPSHIFVRLGLWKQAIDSNTASADAARAYGEAKHPGAVPMEQLHANDYLLYAYLQIGEDAKAKAIVDWVPTIKKTQPAIDFNSSYALASIPARFAVERHAWKDAAALALQQGPWWEKFPQNEAHIQYAKGLGSAHSGDLEGAKRALARLAGLRDATNDPRYAYFKSHLELQHQAVSAWIANAEGKPADALKALSKAADEEDKIGKSPVSPGPILPIREQLGELLLEMKKPADALVAFERTLKLSPNRFNSVYGAAHAAELAGKPDQARKYFEQLVALAGEADSPRPELEAARAYLAAK